MVALINIIIFIIYSIGTVLDILGCMCLRPPSTPHKAGKSQAAQATGTKMAPPLSVGNKSIHCCLESI